MAANLHYSGSAGGDVNFGRAVGHILLTVVSGTVSLSLDGGDNFISFPATGFYSFPVGPTKMVTMGGTGDWELVGIQV